MNNTINQALNNATSNTMDKNPNNTNKTQNNAEETKNMNNTNNAQNNTESTISNNKAKAITKKYNKLTKGKDSLDPKEMHLVVTKKARNLINDTDLMNAYNTFADTIAVYDLIKGLKAPEELMNPIRKEVRDAENKALTKAINEYRFEEKTGAIIQRIAENHFTPTSKENLTLIEQLLEKLGLEAQGDTAMAEVAFYINSIVATKETTNLQFVRNDAASRIDFPSFYRQIVRMMVILVNRDNERASGKTRLERIKEENGTLKEFLEAKEKEAEEKAKKKAENAQKKNKKGNKKNNTEEAPVQTEATPATNETTEQTNNVQ